MPKLMERMAVRKADDSCALRTKLPEVAEATRGVKHVPGLLVGVHEVILAIDSELATTTDSHDRELMVKAAYALRSLDEELRRPQMVRSVIYSC